jgi:hypothetical protein
MGQWDKLQDEKCKEEWDALREFPCPTCSRHWLVLSRTRVTSIRETNLIFSYACNAAQEKKDEYGFEYETMK